MPPRTSKPDPGYADEDYDPDTDMPDTSEADRTLDDALNTNTESGIGHSKVLQGMEKDYAKKNADIEKARADAAKSMVRSTEDDGGV